MKRLLLLIFSVFALHLAAYSQMAEPVIWSYTSEKITDNQYTITLSADIADGWYLYSQDLPQRGPVPTKINFDHNPNIILQGKPQELGDKKETYDQNFNMTVTKFSGKTHFIQKISVTTTVPYVKGTLSYMSCNGQMCMPPRTIKFDVPLKE